MRKITQLLILPLLILAMYSCQPAAKKAAETTNVGLANVPEWSKNAVMYEVNVRQYTPEGTFKAFETQLPRLKEMGVDLSLIHISEPTRLGMISYAVFCLKKKKTKNKKTILT